MDGEVIIRGARRPPYAPVKGVRDFFEKVRLKAAPGRVDRSYLTALGVAVGNEQHVVAALRFLGLIDESGQPGRHFDVLYMKGPSRQRGLQNIVRAAYPNLFSGELDLRKATRSEVHDHFVRRHGMQGQMARKATALFAMFCALAGIQLSPELAADDRMPGLAAKKLGFAESKRKAGQETAVALAPLGGLPLVANITPEMSEEDIVAFLRRIRRAIAIMSREEVVD